MCNNCMKEKIKYIFYDMNKLLFFDDKENFINNMKNIIKSLYKF